MLASLFSLATTRPNGWVLWNRPFNWNPVCQRELWPTAFSAGHCGFRSPSIQSKRRQTNRQTDREGWQEIEITRSTSTLKGMNHLAVSVTLPFLSPHLIYLSSTLAAHEWPFRSHLLWNVQSPSENTMMTCEAAENFYSYITVFIFGPLFIYSTYFGMNLIIYSFSYYNREYEHIHD